jgi:hypothetical protein
MSAKRPLPPTDVRDNRLVLGEEWKVKSRPGSRSSIQTVELVDSLTWWRRPKGGSKLNGTGLEMQPQSGQFQTGVMRAGKIAG